MIYKNIYFKEWNIIKIEFEKMLISIFGQIVTCLMLGL